MEEKSKFADFIIEKRKEAGLTQEELASRLFVSNTAVSKWERGISYPDITLISSICRELNITEHEFITASNDTIRKTEQKQAKFFRGIVKAYDLIFLISYGIAILTCFIVNLAVSHELSWFFVVLTGIGIAFSITNLPFILKRTGLIKNYKINLLVCYAVMTLFIYLVLICAYKFTYYGGWKLGDGCLIATVSVIVPFLMLVVALFLKENKFIKLGYISLLGAILQGFINPVINYIDEGKNTNFFELFSLTNWNANQIGNKISLYVFLITGVILLIIGYKKKINDKM